MITDGADLRERIEQIHQVTAEYGERYGDQLALVHPKQRRSAANLVHYLALRSRDTRDLQDGLAVLGLSRLGGAESHVQASLNAVEAALCSLQSKPAPKRAKTAVSIKKGRRYVRRNTTKLFGKKLKGAVARIMVTQPAEAATDPDLVRELVEAGMNLARINCAHDGPAAWNRMIDHVSRARGRTGRACRVAMDLAGPKIRTGPLRPGPEVVRLRTKKDQLGRVVSYPQVVLCGSTGYAANGDGVELPVEAAWIAQLGVGDVLKFEDARGKRRELVVDRIVGSSAHATCSAPAYLTSGTPLRVEPSTESDALRETRIGAIPAIEGVLTLAAGDAILLTRDPAPGGPPEVDADGTMIRPAHVSCTLPEVLDRLSVGDPVSFDDGRIDGLVSEVSDEGVLVAVTYARGGAGRLRADKGINFPRTDLALSGLTAKDRQDLAFVAEHADIVSLSFVNSAEDVRDLLDELDRLGAPDLGVILKIETMAGYHRLPDILLEAMRHHPVGVMLARGDLAVEAGWKRLAQVQEEIMWLCEAAHVPVVWATQVLENLAKSGVPSRAEITDVAMAERAECVMLNKGPHILAAIKLLDQLLRSMQDYHVKTSAMKPSLELRDDWANISYAGALPTDWDPHEKGN